MSTLIDKEHFQAFCSLLTIPSKEGEDDTGGQLVPLVLLPTQEYALDEIIKGWNKGIHFFVVLKCRQSGITTMGLALDLYWSFRHDGLVHNFIGDCSKVTRINRCLCREFVESLQKYPEWRQDIRDDNDDMMSFGNRSKIIWHMANTRDGSGLGKSVGAAAAHGTELGSWKDEEGMSSLMSSLAQMNRNRLFLWEGTATSSQTWHDMWDEASGEGNTAHHAIFIGWWRHPWYESRLDTPEGRNQHNVYWESKRVLDRDEQVWVDGVKAQYGYEIRPTQISWWRWFLKEAPGVHGNREIMHQNYPPLPSYAWRYGARAFISTSKIVERETIIIERREAARRFFRFDFGRGSEFNDSRVIEVDPSREPFDTVTWEDPEEPQTGVRYAIGCDPSHGADERSDDASIEVLRCYSDQAVQVAEFCRNEVPAYQLAWVVLHLAGTYNAQPHFCTEVQGGGYEIQNHIKMIQMNQAWGYSPILEKAFAGLSFFIWTRPDARKGLGTSFGFKTGGDSKPFMLTTMRDLFERYLLDIRSRPLLNEMRAINWTKDGDLDVPRPNHRLMAFGMAIMAYQQVLTMDIGGAKDASGESIYTRKWWEAKKREAAGQTQEEYLSHLLHDWRDKLILAKKDEQFKEKRDDISDRPIRHYR